VTLIPHEIQRRLGKGGIVILSGAGISTDSGIPDYRGPGTLQRARKPIQFSQFVGSEHGRQRYWARSAAGWPRIEAAVPNAAHRALASLEQGGVIRGIITQNVDRLHAKAGSSRVIELHGALAEVRCLDCGELSARSRMQERILAGNPSWREASAPQAPDGDADVEDLGFQDFCVPSCERCQGALKPNVVFFGESVPRQVVDEAWALYEEAATLVVVGSSLTVYSGFRFIRRAASDGKSIVIINNTETRGDALANYIWRSPLGEALPALDEAWRL